MRGAGFRWLVWMAAALPGACAVADDAESGGWQAPRVVAPRIVAAPLRQPRVELPWVGWPELAPVSVAAPQLERPALVEPELLDPYQVDIHRQRELVVDVLWIVDESGSMADDRTRLARSFEHFISQLSRRRIDYQVGVISTLVRGEPSDGALREVEGVRFLTPDQPDQVARFARLVDFPPSDERREQGLEAMRLALSEPRRSGVNAGFLRPHSTLAVVAVSDEDDGSFGQPEHFARFLTRTREPGDERLASLSAIVGLPPEGCVAPGEEGVFGARADPAWRYLAVVDATRGLQGSICETDFDPLLEALGRRVGALARSFPVSSIPQVATLSLAVDGRLIPAQGPEGVNWSYDPSIRAVVFTEEATPPSGSELRIAYVVDRGGQP